MNILEKSLITIKCLPNMEQEEKKSPSQSKWKRGVGSEFLMKGQSGAAKGVFGKKVNTGKKLSQGLGRSGRSSVVTGKSAICALKEDDEKSDTHYIRTIKNIELSFSLIVSAQRRPSQTSASTCKPHSQSFPPDTGHPVLHLLEERRKSQGSNQSCGLVSLPCV